MFELGKTPNVDKKSFVLIVNEFWGCVGLSFEEYVGWYWFGGVVVKREMFGFQRKYCQNFAKTHALVLDIN